MIFNHFGSNETRLISNHSQERLLEIGQFDGRLNYWSVLFEMKRENFQMIVSSFTGEESNLWKADLKGGIILDNLEAIWEF